MKKITFLLLAMAAFCWQSYAQTSDLYLTMIDNGCCDGEKWVSITTGPNGTGTVIFAQGDGTYSNGSGLLTDAMFTVDDGATYYINAYDQYDDTWDGDTYEIRSAPAGGGFLVANNGGDSPDDGNDEDVSSAWGDTQEQELEVSEAFSFTPPTCTPVTVDTATVVDDCGNNQFSVDVVVSDVGDGTVITDGTNDYTVVAGTVTAGPYTNGDTVTLDVAHSDGACDFTLGDFSTGCTLPGETCSNPIVIGSLPYNTTDDTANYGDDYDNGDSPCSAYYMSGDDVVYSFTPANNGTFTVSLSNIGATYSGIHVLDDCPENTPTCVGFEGNSGTSDRGFDVSLTGGTTYYIIISTWATPQSTSYTLDITELACTPVTVDSSTVVDDCGNNQFSVDVVVSDVGDGTVITDGTNDYTVVAGTVTAGPYTNGDTVTLDVAHSDGACDFTLGDFTTGCTLPGETCSNPIVIGSLPYNTTDDTANYGDDYENGDSPCSAYYMSGDDVVYSFTPANNGTFTVSLSNIGATYSGIHVLDDCPENTPTCVGFEGNSGTSDRGFDVSLTGGTTYYIIISTWATPQSTSYTLDITELACTQVTVDSSTIVDDCGNNQFTVDVVVSDVGDGTVITDGTNDYTVVAGTVTAGPYPADGNAVTLDVVHSDNACNFSLGSFNFACPPVNDEASAAETLTVGDTICEGKIEGTNVGATDSAEAGASCGTPTSDVWYKVVVPSTGELTIETSTSTGANPLSDTVMAVYSGVSGSLVEVACDDDGGTGNLSLIELTGLTPGDVLMIRIWAYSNITKGTFDICVWSPSTLGVEDNNFNGFSYYPNPVKDVLTLNSPIGIDNVSVYNIVGQRIMGINDSNIQNVDMSALQSGVYLVKVSIDGQTKTLRLVKQ